MKLLNFISIVAVSVMLLMVGCADVDEGYESERAEEGNTEMTESERMKMEQGKMEQGKMQNVKTAVAVLNPTEGNNVEGKITFTKAGNGVRVEGKLSGLQQGMHGFHIHQYGDCSAPDGTSAGGHFNPGNNEHGARTDSVRHMGDMGNIQAGSNGSASVAYTDSKIKMNQILGRAVIVHGGEDDFTSQPSGDAGPRMACGVIGVAEGGDAMMEDEGSMEEDSMEEGN